MDNTHINSASNTPYQANTAAGSGQTDYAAVLKQLQQAPDSKTGVSQVLQSVTTQLASNPPKDQLTGTDVMSTLTSASETTKKVSAAMENADNLHEAFDIISKGGSIDFSDPDMKKLSVQDKVLLIMLMAISEQQESVNQQFESLTNQQDDAKNLNVAIASLNKSGAKLDASKPDDTVNLKKATMEIDGKEVKTLDWLKDKGEATGGTIQPAKGMDKATATDVNNLVTQAQQESSAGNSLSQQGMLMLQQGVSVLNQLITMANSFLDSVGKIGDQLARIE